MSARFRVDCPFAPAKALLEKYLERLNAPAGVEVSLRLLPPDPEAPRWAGDERFSIRSDGRRAVLNAHSPRGAMYAASALLEDFCGVDFLTADCDALPEAFCLKAGERNYAPAFSYREAYWRGALPGEFALKLRLNSARADIPDEWGGRVPFYNYSHTFEVLVPPETYFDGHPEYFAYFNGARQREHAQLCLTNPEVLRLCVEGVRRWMREHPGDRIFSVAQNDWYGYCECPACRALDEREGSHAGSLIHFVNAVADAIKDEFPDNFIHTFAYLYGRACPRFVRPRENVIVRLCSIECCFSHPMGQCEKEIAAISVDTNSAERFTERPHLFTEDLADWGRAAKNLFIWDYTTNYANYLSPFPNLHVLADNLRLMRAHGVSGVFEQGNYSPGRTSAFAGLKVYLIAHLLWDPEADWRALTERFLAGYFGPAAEPLARYLRLMEESAKRAHMGIFDAADAPAISDEAVAEGLLLMDGALSRCETEAQRERVRLERLSPEFLRLTRLPMDAPGRSAQIDAFADEARRLGVTELFERRDFGASVQCMKDSRCCLDREGLPYTVYRL